MFPHESHFLALTFTPPANQPALSGLNVKGYAPLATPHVNLSLPHNGQELRVAEPLSSASLLMWSSQSDCVLLSIPTKEAGDF
jgi:hypothetical protein